MDVLALLPGKVTMEVHTGTKKMEVTARSTNTEDEINLEVRSHTLKVARVFLSDGSYKFGIS
jgi:hypothetical protein